MAGCTVERVETASLPQASCFRCAVFGLPPRYHKQVVSATPLGGLPPRYHKQVVFVAPLGDCRLASTSKLIDFLAFIKSLKNVAYLAFFRRAHARLKPCYRLGKLWLLLCAVTSRICPSRGEPSTCGLG